MALDASQREALTQLSASTAEAVARTLEMFVPEGVERGDVSIVAEDQTPFSNLPIGGVASSVSYVNGVNGANVFLMPSACVRKLAAAMMGADAPESDSTELTELETSAVGEAANQMLAAAAAAISVVIGQEIEISPPDVRLIEGRMDPVEVWGTAPYACVTSFIIAGEPCRLVQLVPSAFVVRMARAIEELNVQSDASVQAGGGFAGGGSGPEDQPVSVTEALEEVNLRVWAELGRTQLTLGHALELPPGAVVDLDRAADAPIDLFVNGLCFGQGRLLVTEDGEWAIEVGSLSKPAVRRPSLLGGAGVDADPTHERN